MEQPLPHPKAFPSDERSEERFMGRWLAAGQTDEVVFSTEALLRRMFIQKKQDPSLRSG